MPLLAVEAQKLSRDQLERGIIEEVLDRDDLFSLIPFTQVNGKSYSYDRENAPSSADFLDPNDPIAESAASFNLVTTRLRVLAGDVDIDKFLAGTLDDTNDQVAIQIAQKAKAVARMWSTALASGNATTNPKSFDGLSQLVTAAQTFRADGGVLGAGTGAGAALALTMLDQLKDMLPLGVDAYCMRKGTWRAIKVLLRLAGGNTGEMLQLENFGRPIPAIDGVPVLLNDFLPNNETCGTNANTCSIYALRLNEADGLHGIYGGPSAGFVVENIGTVQNKDAMRIRIKWYTGLVLKSTRSLARMTGVTNI